ncbi:phosphoribosylformylglycinamidine synthase I, partial [Arthrospira sp. O9.13F]
AHGEGCYYADEKTLAQLEDNNQVVFRYEGDNPNGSLNNIAGICNQSGTVVGMMPHPERAADPMLGNTDGIKMFEAVLQQVVRARV